MKSSFFIVADRGNLKAFRAEAVPGDRPPRLQLVQALTLTDAHTKISERNTDQAGSFPTGAGPAGGNGRHQNAIAETHLELEIDKRLIKTLAGHITTILKSEQPRNWSFAAPSAINGAVLDLLGTELREHLAENVAADLVKLEPSALLSHFTAVRAA